MKDITPQKLKEGLERYYNRLPSLAEGFDYLIGVYQYVSYIHKHPSLTHIIDEEIDADRRELYDESERIAESAKKELKKVYSATKKYVADKGIKDEIIQHRLDRFVLYEKGQIISSAGEIAEMYDSLLNALKQLRSIGHEKFVKKYIEEREVGKDKKKISHYNLSESEPKYRDLQEKIGRRKEIEGWGAMVELKLLYQAVECYKGNYEAVEGNRLLMASSGFLADLVYKVKKEGESAGHGALWGNPKKNVERLHLSLLDAIDELDENVELEENEPKKKESKVNGKLQPHLLVEKNVGYFKFHKQGKKIKIGSPKTRKYRLVKVLANPLGLAKTVDVVFDAIKLPKDKEDTDLADDYTGHAKKVYLIEITIKELQKIKEFQNKKLQFEFIDQNQRQIRMLVN